MASKIDDLTVGEAFLIQRRREGVSQKTMADRYGLTRNYYGEIERDAVDNHSFTAPAIDKLTNEEICLLLRRRKGINQEECAEQLGVTRFWYNQMEMGKVPNSDMMQLWGVSNDRS